jgi:hypothetical protein
MTMSYHDEQRRKFNEASRDGGPPLKSGIEWGLPLGIAGAVLVIGLIFYNVSHQATTTASNTGGTVQSTPQKAAPPAKTQ